MGNNNKIYIIEYQSKGEHYNDYAKTFEAAENHLRKQGYNKIQEYNEQENDAGLYEFLGNEFFAPQKARIISRKSLD